MSSIDIKHLARIPLPVESDLRRMVLNMFYYTRRDGGGFFNYEIHEDLTKKKWLFVPPNMAKLQTISSILGLPIRDLRGAGVQPIEFSRNPSFKFRDYQKEPAEAFARELSRTRMGTLNAGCGTGKTVVMTYAAGVVGYKTLVLVDMSNLMRNWKEAFKLVWNKELIQLKSGDHKKPLPDCAITTFQLLHKNKDLLKAVKEFYPTCMVDESHVAKADTFKYVLFRLNNYVRAGCSATFFTKNIPTEALVDLVGPVLVKMVDENAVTPDILQVSTGVPFASDDPNNFSSTLSALSSDSYRLGIVVDLVEAHAKEGRRIAVIAIDNSHARAIELNLKMRGVKTKLYVGTTTEAQDADIVTGLEELRYQVVITCKKLDKGVDIPSLDTIHITRPTNNKAATQQQSGRTTRSYAGKKSALVVDYVDAGDLADTFAKNRVKLYKSLKYKIL